MSKGSEYREKIRKIETIKKYAPYTIAAIALLYALSQIPYVKRAVDSQSALEKYFRSPIVKYEWKKGDLIDKLLIKEGVPKKELNIARQAMDYMNSGIDSLDFAKPKNLDKLIEGDIITAIDCNSNGKFGE